MAIPQSGIFALGTSSHAYLEFDALASDAAPDLVGAVASLREPRTTMGGVNLVAGFRPELWRNRSPDDTPPGIEGFNDDLHGPDGYLHVIGRTKDDSLELADRGRESHVSRTDQDHLGKIFRRNMPYGTVTDHGTMFVGFSVDQQRLAAMLASMAGLTDGVRDALTRYSRPLTGAYYFVPSTESLRRLTTAGI